MSTIVGELIKDAYLFAGIGDQYNPIDADSTNLALRFLNDLADSYSSDELKIFRIGDIFLPLTIGERNYDISATTVLVPGIGTQVTLPPATIEAISIYALSGVTPQEPGNVVKFVGVAEWNSIIPRGAPGRPYLCWMTKNPNGTHLRFWPTPDSSLCAQLFCGDALAEFTSVGDSYEAPPGYRLFFKTALAKVLASINKIALSKDQNDVIAAAELTMKARNSRRRILTTDVPQDKMAGNWFNIFTGYPN
jgi:hypothetical protein